MKVLQVLLDRRVRWEMSDLPVQLDRKEILVRQVQREQPVRQELQVQLVRKVYRAARDNKGLPATME